MDKAIVNGGVGGIRSCQSLRTASGGGCRSAFPPRRPFCWGVGGFTLIELMVVVAVIGILAAIAYPSYTQYVRKAYMADGQAFLMTLAQELEKYSLDNRGYPVPAAPSGGGTQQGGSNQQSITSLSTLMTTLRMGSLPASVAKGFGSTPTFSYVLGNNGYVLTLSPNSAAGTDAYLSDAHLPTGFNSVLILGSDGSRCKSQSSSIPTSCGASSTPWEKY